jgi:P4 family phage/plasmid primase-like protien
MARTVSQILLEDFSISIRPGGKGECPTCHGLHFSLKSDDSLGKCFSPPCGFFLTLGHDAGHDRQDIARVLTAVYQDCHQELLQLATGQQNAYTYCYEKRGIHPQVLADAMLGAVPSSYDVTTHFRPVLDDAQQALAALQGPHRGRPTKQLAQAQQRLQDLQDAQQKLVDCLSHKAGWLMFFYCNASHHPVALRLRQPYSRKFVSFKPGIAGVFGRELFTPYSNPANQALNDFLLVTEGEFNALQLQSLTVRYAEALGQPSAHCYHHACAVGGVLVADGETIKRVAQRPVICYDNDTNQAGFELVRRLQQVMAIEATTTPLTWGSKSDLDSYIRDFDQDHVAAWEAVKALIAAKQPYGRVYSGTGEEFFDVPVNGKREVFIPKLLGDALRARQTYRYTASQLWIYRGGVYLPCGEATLRADAQELLGQERREERINEALHYVKVATHVDEESPPDCQYINVCNGRLDWKLGILEPHTSAVFTTVQLPFDYDALAICPTFDRYLGTTFEPDDLPLIEEILGWCLLPDRRFEQAVMLTGEGENGKSVFLDLVGDLLGEANIANVALQDLEENRFRTAELYGKLANIFADLDARGLHTSSMFKTLTTGDYVTAERKHAQPFRFRSYAKLLFSANRIPASRDRTHAFYRRWLIIPFTRTFDGVGTNPAPDKTLRHKLKKELPGIFNRAICGLARLTANEAFTKSKNSVEAKKAYIRSNDNLRVFAEECLLANPIGTITKKEFYDVYEQWCDSYGDRPVSQKLLKDALKQIFPGLDEWREHNTSPRCWLGIEWSDDAASYKPASLSVGGQTI